jgi:methionine synthase reductase
VRYTLDHIDKKFDIEREKLIVFCVSTTGEGEAPDNALKFWRRVRKRTLPQDYLSGLRYGLLGLGDSNYNRFANFGREVDNRLEALSAQRFIKTGFGDDAVGLEVGVEPWITELILTLPHILGLSVIEKIPTVMSTAYIDLGKEPSLLTSSSSLATLTELSLPNVSVKFKELMIEFTDVPSQTTKSLSCLNDFPKLPVMESELFDAEVVNIRELTTESTTEELDEKIILEAEVYSKDLPPFSPGDSFGFLPGNPEEEVNEVLKVLGFQNQVSQTLIITTPKTLSHIPKNVTLWNLLKYFVELRSVPRKSFLRHLSEFTEDVVQKRRLLELSSKEGADDYAAFIRNGAVNIMDILRTFPSCRPSLECIVFNLPCFVPRYYSVVNFVIGKNDNNHTFKIIFSVTRTKRVCERKGSQSFGVFTGQLYKSLTDQAKNEEIIQEQIEKAIGNLSVRNDSLFMKSFKRKNPYFLLSDLTAPLILVGPGTGVAPFIGFLEKRRYALQTSQLTSLPESWLFFGCRSQREFIFEKELKQFRGDKILTHLEVCFSRETSENKEPKVKYVQELIKTNGEELYQLLQNPKTMIYVCGDMKSMSVEVFNAFVSVVEEFGHEMHESAIQKLKDMQSSRRYLEDIWT